MHRAPRVMGDKTIGKDGPTVADRLAEYICGLRFDDLPAAVVDKAKELLVYHLSLGFTGHSWPAGQTAVSLAQELSGEPGSASIIGEPGQVRPLEAAFANAGLMVQSHEDDVLPPMLHPGRVMHPTAWAIGEDCHVSGRELLTALVVGYDVMGKLSDPLPRSDDYRRRPQYRFTTFGGAATAARLLGLSADQVAQAMAQAGHAGMGVVEGSEHFWNVNSRLTTGGMMAAYLARAGALAAPRTIEGAYGFYQFYFGAVPDGLDASLDRLGSHFAISDATTKPISASGTNIPALQIACSSGRRATSSLRTSRACVSSWQTNGAPVTSTTKATWSAGQTARTRPGSRSDSASLRSCSMAKSTRPGAQTRAIRRCGPCSTESL